jgi:hypothetical protein
LENINNQRSLDSLKIQIESQYDIELTKKGNSFIVFPSGTLIHIRGSKILSDTEGQYGFYHFFKKNFESLLNTNKSFFALVYNEPKNTFLIPKDKLSTIFNNNLITYDEKSSKWYFYIRPLDNKYFIEFRQKNSDKVDITDYLNKWDQIDDLVGTRKKEYQYFLVQVTEAGSLEILDKNMYQSQGWKINSRNHDHGKVKKGDILVVYFAGNSVRYNQQLKKIYTVDNVSPDNAIFQLNEIKELEGISLNEIKSGIKTGRLSKTFERIGMQGFNIKQITESEYNSVLRLEQKPFDNINILLKKQPKTWVVRAGEKGDQEEGALLHNIITIGWNELPDLSIITDKYSLSNTLNFIYKEYNKQSASQAISQIWNFLKGN